MLIPFYNYKTFKRAATLWQELRIKTSITSSVPDTPQNGGTSVTPGKWGRVLTRYSVSVAFLPVHL